MQNGGENITYLGPRETPDLTDKEGYFVRRDYGVKAHSVAIASTSTGRVIGLVMVGRPNRAGSSIADIRQTGSAPVRFRGAAGGGVEVAVDATSSDPGRGKAAVAGDRVVGITQAAVTDGNFQVVDFVEPYLKP